MTTHTTNPTRSRPTKYYFAYGSNLHLKQMKRRCPNSKYIGYARLSNYRWQINERGYANVIEADGQWVDGLVYEIDEKDEAKLDINEGVSKSAYTKQYMSVCLHRAHSALYRRPTAWIVNKGGPAKVRLQARPIIQNTPKKYKHWENQVLVYISLNYIEDSTPRKEYVSRINLGLADAKALGIEEDYIQNCIRPFVPKPSENTPGASSGKERGTATTQEAKRNASAKKVETSPSRQNQAPTQVDDNPPLRKPSKAALRNDNNINQVASGSQKASSGTAPPPLPPRPVQHLHSIPIITVEEVLGSSSKAARISFY